MESLKEFQIKDNEALIQQVTELKDAAALARQQLLENEFHLPSDITNKDEMLKYIILLIPLVSQVVLFPDDQLLNKMKELKMSTPVTKWFTPIDDITKELYELRKVKGAVFSMNAYLTAAQYYIEYAVVVELIESFDLQKRHGKMEEVNFLVKNLDNFYRRRQYNSLKQQKGKMNKGDEELREIHDKADKKFGNEINFPSLLLKALKGDFVLSKELFSSFRAMEISESQFYCHLFPLIKLVYKDRQLYSEMEFNDLDELLYGGSYKKYKISRVKKILSIK